MAAHQAPPSLGFSRQEQWSELPFPSPMNESESEVAQSCLTLSDPMHCSLPGSSFHGSFQVRVGCHCLLCNEDLVLPKKKEILPEKPVRSQGKHDMKKDETSLGLISCKSWRGKLQPVFTGNLGYKLLLKCAPTQG